MKKIINDNCLSFSEYKRDKNKTIFDKFIAEIHYPILRILNYIR